MYIQSVRTFQREHLFVARGERLAAHLHFSLGLWARAREVMVFRFAINFVSTVAYIWHSDALFMRRPNDSEIIRTDPKQSHTKPILEN